ncbi:MAG: FAD-dependent tricarballylate dehydrogenase TcuA [Acidimicrobiales bacterium]
MDIVEHEDVTAGADRVVVIGAGNAALSAAIAAAEAGAPVVVLEAADEFNRGGNSAYTAGAMRIAYDGRDDLATLMDLTRPPYDTADFGSYPADDYLIDLDRMSDGRVDPDLAAVVATEGLATLRWHRGLGVRYEPNEGRQSAMVDGRLRFWGALPVRVAGEGKAMIASLLDAAIALGVEVRYGHEAADLVVVDGRMTAVALADGLEVPARAVVIAAGGFEADPVARAERLGPEWVDAKVRGTASNTGAGIEMAVRAGAARRGDQGGCHAVAWDRSAPLTGDITVAHRFSKNAYPWGITVNRSGRRFMDEAADFRNYTYAAYGRAVLAQPGAVAWQVFDAKVLDLLYPEYELDTVDRFDADSLADLAGRIGDLDTAGFLATVEAYNAAVDVATPFDPTMLDGRAALLPVPRANWAQRLDTPPFRAYAVTCGITFTFGGLAVDPAGRVLTDGGAPLPGVFACGELVGGLFWGNYPGGAGLTAGAVLGRRAGRSAAAFLAARTGGD